jgi:hypothetical protein
MKNSYKNYDKLEVLIQMTVNPSQQECYYF